MKLIDNVGDFGWVVKDTAKSVGISGEPTLVHPEKDRKTLLDLMTRRRLAIGFPGARRCRSSRLGFIISVK